VDDVLTAVLAQLEPRLGSLEGEPEVLSGGITNRNVKVRLGGRDLVLRLCGKDTEVLSIDRATEVEATRNAHAAGVAPEVVAWLDEPQCLVTAFVPGRPVDAAALREPAALAQVAAALRAVHGGPPLGRAFPTFTLAEEYAATARERGGTPPADDHALALELSARIGAALAGRPGHEPVPCHNDLLTANFIDDGERITIVDWEYAGMNDRYFDLGNLAVNNGLGEDDEAALLEAYLGAPPTAAQAAALRLMRLMSDVREAMWAVLQAVVSDLDFDYDAYAAEHFARLRAGAEDPRLEEWIRAASA
jgi:thiamine kinase-like enzyme